MPNANDSGAQDHANRDALQSCRPAAGAIWAQGQGDHFVLAEEFCGKADGRLGLLTQWLELWSA